MLTVTAPVDVIAGFEVEFSDDTFIILNPLSGELVEENLYATPIPSNLNEYPSRQN